MNSKDLKERIDEWEILCQIKDYPCKYCSRAWGENWDCSNNHCPKWLNWFSIEWARLKNNLKKNLKKIKKTIDKYEKVWYNIIRKKQRKQF